MQQQAVILVPLQYSTAPPVYSQYSQNVNSIQLPVYQQQVYTPPPYNPQYIAPSYSQQSVGQQQVQILNKPERWSTDLSDCCDDVPVCCCGMLFPCCLFGKNASSLDQGTCIGNCLCYLLCCGCCQHTAIRYTLRTKYNLPAESCGDCEAAWCCGPCALCQEAREIKFRNLQSTNRSGPQKQFMN
jgi:Cys-rich protein (TIGR01571 family)